MHKPIINGNLFEPNRNKPRPTVPPNVGVVHVNDKKHSTSIHQFSFITHSKPKHPGHPPSQSHSVQLFRPATSYTPSKHQHKQPPHNDTWEINFVVPQGLRDLLKLEREKLRNLTYGIDGKYKGRKWPVTSSRSAHRDNDIFIGRANNPFGHSTKWKLRWVRRAWRPITLFMNYPEDAYLCTFQEVILSSHHWLRFLVV